MSPSIMQINTRTFPDLTDLADRATTAELYAELCRECGLDPIVEEGAILSAVGAAHPPAGSADYWLFMAGQTWGAWFQGEV